MATVVGKDTAALKRVTCYMCASIVEYAEAEVKVRKDYDYTGYYDLTRYINCPCCSHDIKVK